MIKNTSDNKLTGYPSIDKPWLKYYSEEAINAPLPECTIYEYLWEKNKDYLDNVALNYFDHRITFRELFDNTEKAAKAFSTIGLKQGDIIVMATVTTPETIYAFYGLNRLGVIANMVDPRTSIEGIKDYITEVNAKVVLTIDAAYPKIEKAIVQTSVKKVIVVSPADSLAQPKKLLFNISKRLKGAKPKLQENCLRWNQFIANGETAHPQYASYQKDTCCVIVHTGGTTGVPKGVMLSNNNLNALAYQYHYCGIKAERGSKFLNIMPPFIAYGIAVGIHMPLVLGMKCIILPHLVIEEFVSLMLKYKPEFVTGGSVHYERFLSDCQAQKLKLNNLECTGIGGDGITRQFEKNINDFLHSQGSKHGLAKGYGMTEISSAASTTHYDVDKLGSVGIPHIKNVISIFDNETCKELENGEQGEVCVSAPTVMIGYGIS